jgi:hypothetical protein
MSSLLKEKLGGELHEAVNVFSLTATLVPSENATERFTVDAAYLQSFGAQFQQCFMNEVDAAAVEYNKCKSDAAVLGISNLLLEEFLHHSVWARKKKNSFCRRQTLVQTVLKYMNKEAKA